LISRAITLNCLRAAGRYTSTDTTIGELPFFDSQRASFPVEVVLPDPCSPTIIITVGGSLAMRSFDWCVPNIFTISSLTILTTCCEGDSAVSTSWPMAFSLTAS
jgi:hypothetical protein